jgi:hypothetical protein
MWPLPPLSPASDVSAQLTLLFVLSVIFVLGVFVGLLVRVGRSRRTILSVPCPENDDRPALIVVDRSADGPTVAHCSRWHDRPLDCGERCLDERAGS